MSAEIIQFGRALAVPSTVLAQGHRAGEADLARVRSILNRKDTSGADPILSMIERHREAVAVINDRETFTDDPDASDMACDAERAVEARIRSGRYCKTLAGAVAALRYIGKVEIDGLCDNKHTVHFMLRMADVIERLAVAEATG